MLLVLQIPIVDLRLFVSQSLINSAPDWRMPQPENDEFVRFFGRMKRRPRGGDATLHDELYFCASHGALKLPAFRGRSLTTGLGQRMAFRRILNDGFGVVRCEIGLHVITRQLSTVSCLKVLKEFFDTPCLVRLPDGTTKKDPLLKSRNSLCRLYEAASRAKGAQARTDLVVTGKPCLLVEYSAAELAEVPKIISSRISREGIGYGHISHRGTEVSAWFVKAEEQVNSRSTRITLLRLHAEHQALRVVVRGLKQTIAPPPESGEVVELKSFICRTLDHLMAPNRFGVNPLPFVQLKNVYERLAASDDIPIVVANLARFSSQIGLNLKIYLEGNSGKPKAPQVLISYSRRDKKWLDRLQVHLAPLLQKGVITIWADTQIRPGQEWKTEIESAIASARVAVLLVTPDFLASDFIHKNELPPLLEAAEAKGLTILWVAVSVSMHEMADFAKYQAVNDPSQPLSSLREAECEEALLQIARRINEAAQAKPAVG